MDNVTSVFVYVNVAVQRSKEHTNNKKIADSFSSYRQTTKTNHTMSNHTMYYSTYECLPITNTNKFQGPINSSAHSSLCIVTIQCCTILSKCLMKELNL